MAVRSSQSAAPCTSLRRKQFDEKDLAEITDEEHFPSERLIVCRNSLLADERARKREELLNSDHVVLTYQSLAKVERAFRSLKSINLHIRHWNDDRIRTHVFLCMLAYNVEWPMRDALCELIFDDDDIEAAQATRRSVVAKAKRSESAKQKDATRRTPEDLPVQSFQDLLKDMGTLTRNRIRFESSASEFNQLTESTTLQRRVLDLLSTHA